MLTNNRKVLVEEFFSVETSNDQQNTAKTFLEQILAVIFWTELFGC